MALPVTAIAASAQQVIQIGTKAGMFSADGKREQRRIAAQAAEDFIVSDQVPGLGTLLRWMDTMETPPRKGEDGGKRPSGYVIQLAVVLGLADDRGAWASDRGKANAYNLVREYLLAFDRLTGQRYNFASYVPGPIAVRKDPYHPEADPAGLHAVLRRIGYAGLRAIDAGWAGVVPEAPEVGEVPPGQWEELRQALDTARRQVTGAVTEVVAAGAEGAVTGIRGAAAGAAAGAELGRAGALGGVGGLVRGNLVTLAIAGAGVLLIVALLRRR